MVEFLLVDLELALEPVLGQRILDDQTDLPVLRLQGGQRQRGQQTPARFVLHPGGAELQGGVVAQLADLGHRRAQALTDDLVAQPGQRRRAGIAMAIEQVHHQRVDICLGHRSEAKPEELSRNSDSKDGFTFPIEPPLIPRLHATPGRLHRKTDPPGGADRPVQLVRYLVMHRPRLGGVCGQARREVAGISSSRYFL